ncbi:AMP-binding protein [Parafrankia sp. FMc2]|uniref:AMP-binding protein n=1 Tax=Parafrankia sp. FMc2 TaxID=3233196 RepID=UPI0034D5A654
MARVTSADESTVVFLVSPLTSITGLTQIQLAADQHGTPVLEDHFQPDQTLRRMNRAGATLLGGAPVIAERLLAAAASAAPGTGLRLRTLALGGAMLPRPLLELATDAFGVKITRVYGSSEAPLFSGSLPSDGRERRLSDDGALMPGGEVRTGSAAHPREGSPARAQRVPGIPRPGGRRAADPARPGTTREGQRSGAAAAGSLTSTAAGWAASPAAQPVHITSGS